MTRLKMCVYRHEHAEIRIDEYKDVYRVSCELEVQALRDASTGKMHARFAAFPAQIGAGDSDRSALDSLREIYRTWVKTFILENGIPVFAKRLIDMGFKNVTEFETVQSAWSQNWQPVLQRDTVPSIEVPLAKAV